jgi:hypothetical protein
MDILIPPTCTAKELMEELTKIVAGSCDIAELYHEKDIKKYNIIMRGTKEPRRILVNLISAQDKDQKQQDAVLRRSKSELEAELRIRLCVAQTAFSGHDSSVINARGV